MAMRKQEAAKVEAGARVVYLGYKKGTVRERFDEYPVKGVPLPLFHVDFDDGESFAVTYSLLKVED